MKSLGEELEELLKRIKEGHFDSYLNTRDWMLIEVSLSILLAIVKKRG